MTTAVAQRTGSDQQDRQQDQWRKIGVLGTALNGVLWLSFLAIIGEFIAIFPIFAAIFFAFAAMAYWLGTDRRWPWAVLGVATVLYIVASIPEVARDLGYPEEAYIFIPTVISLMLAVAVTVASALLVFRRSFAPKPLVVGLAAITVAASLFSIGSLVTLDGHAQQPGDVVVTEEFPDRLELPAGTYWIYLENNDRVRHTFVVDELDINLDMPSAVGRRAEVTLPAGEYHYYCDVPGHDSMFGTLVVSGTR